MTAKADSHPQGGDSSEAPFMTSAVPEGHSPEASVRTPPTGEGELAREFRRLVEEVHTAHFNPGEFEESPPRFEDADDRIDVLKSLADRILAALSTKGEDKLREAALRAEAWLRECSGWLLATDLDMTCPMQVDPLNIADDIAALTASPTKGVDRHDQ